MIQIIVFLFFLHLILAHPPLMPKTPEFEKYMSSLKRNHIFSKQIIDPSLPINFDGRKQWPNCIHGILDQGDCGSCWSFASTESLSDRFCIFSNENINVVLSPQNLLSCEELNLGCTMGSLPNWAWDYLQSYGVTTMNCDPYTSGGGDVSKCPSPINNCNDGSLGKLYKAVNYTHVGNFIEPSRHIESIMKALLQGPVDATFNVFSDFDGFPFSSGAIYKHTSGEYEGLHSVKVIGYGVQNSTDYWLVQNSWGSSWGDNGFFRIIRGIDDCFFETMMYTGVPLL